MHRGYSMEISRGDAAAGAWKFGGDRHAPQVRDLVKQTSGASRVFIFDHTIRETGVTSLNAAAGGSAAPVPRVHCDYTAEGAPRRLKQLGDEGIYSLLKGRDLTASEVDALAAGRFAFINVWRSIDDAHPVSRSPLAVCDENSIAEADKFKYLRRADRRRVAAAPRPRRGYSVGELRRRRGDESQQRRGRDVDLPWRRVAAAPRPRRGSSAETSRSGRPVARLRYELRFPDRTGENYSLKFSEAHEWFYYPQMTMDECLVFKVFDSAEDGEPRFVFHSAFDDPATSDASPPRKSIEVRCIAFYAKSKFYDMAHSNNAARIRLWLSLVDPSIAAQIDRTVIDYAACDRVAIEVSSPRRVSRRTCSRPSTRRSIL